MIGIIFLFILIILLLLCKFLNEHKLVPRVEMNAHICNWSIYPNSFSHSHSKVTVSLRYGDLVSVLPTRAKVLAWPVHCSKQVILSGGRRAEGPGVTQLIPTHLAFAEEAFRTLGLAEGAVLLFDKNSIVFFFF